MYRNNGGIVYRRKVHTQAEARCQRRTKLYWTDKFFVTKSSIKTSVTNNHQTITATIRDCTLSDKHSGHVSFSYDEHALCLVRANRTSRTYTCTYERFEVLTKIRTAHAVVTKPWRNRSLDLRRRKLRKTDVTRWIHQHLSTNIAEQNDTPEAISDHYSTATATTDKMIARVLCVCRERERESEAAPREAVYKTTSNSVTDTPPDTVSEPHPHSAEEHDLNRGLFEPMTDVHYGYITWLHSPYQKVDRTRTIFTLAMSGTILF